jgi:hypothetical protein
MIRMIEPYACGSAVGILLEPAANTQRWRLLRKESDSFSGEADAGAVLVAEDTDTGILPAVADTGVLDGRTYYYALYEHDGSAWGDPDIRAGEPGYALSDQSADVYTLIRDGLRRGFASEVAAGTLHANRESGRIDVLNAPPQWERTRWPVVTLHLSQDASGERAIGEAIAGGPEPDDGAWQEAEGWLSRWNMKIMVWSLNPDERIVLRQAVKRLVIGLLPLLDAQGVVTPELTMEDVDQVSEFPAPVYGAVGSFTCLAPSVVTHDTPAIARIDLSINGEES